MLVLHAIVLKKPLYKSKEQALKEGHHMFPKEQRRRPRGRRLHVAERGEEIAMAGSQSMMKPRLVSMRAPQRMNRYSSLLS